MVGGGHASPGFVVVPTQQTSPSWQATFVATHVWPQMCCAVQSPSAQSPLLTQWCPFPWPTHVVPLHDM
jgi:hypothetical protein